MAVSDTRKAKNTLFGEHVVGQRYPDILEQFHYNVSTKQVTSTTANGGTVSQDSDMIQVATSTATNGSAIAESVNKVHYRPGHECYAIFTALFTTGVAGAVQWIGNFDSNDGYMLGYNGANFSVNIRKGGTDDITAQSNFNGEDISSIDFTKLNIFRISWGWLGTAPVIWEVMTADGTWAIMHRENLAGTLTAPSVLDPQLPMCMDVTKTSGATNITMKSGSWHAGTIGPRTHAGARYYTKSGDRAAVSTQSHVLSIRNVSTFQGQTNKVDSEVQFIGFAADGTKVVTFKVYKDLTIATPSWTGISTPNSIMEWDTVGIPTFVGEPEIVVPVGRTDSKLIDLRDYGLWLLPGESFTISVESTNSTQAQASIRWREDF